MIIKTTNEPELIYITRAVAFITRETVYNNDTNETEYLSFIRVGSVIGKLEESTQIKEFNSYKIYDVLLSDIITCGDQGRVWNVKPSFTYTNTVHTF